MKIEIKVVPGASRGRIVKKDGNIKVYVASPPEKGKANTAVIDLVAKEWKVKKNAVNIVKGHRSRNKVVEIEM